MKDAVGFGEEAVFWQDDVITSITNVGDLGDFHIAYAVSDHGRVIVGEAGGGLIGQLNLSLGEGFTEFVTGVSPQELQTFRTEAQALVAQSITQFTGEESGRFTERERQLTDEALRLLEGTASFAQIKSATEIATKLAFMQRDRQRFEAGLEFAEDLSTEAGQRALLAEIIRAGASPAVAAETVRELIDLRVDLEAIREAGSGG
jgi:hypothetical protein